MKTEAVKIKNLTKNYKTKSKKEKIALQNIDLSIPNGSIFGLLGPNGAGKSTLINILAGLVLKSSGKVIVAENDLDETPREIRRQIGIVPQEVIIDPFFTVRETLEYYAGFFGIPKKQRQTDKILENLSLTDKANVNSRRLSGGMKRRVLIAKALVHNPKILILDEPTAGVDVELREQLWDYVRLLNKEGMTILLTTHYIEEAEELCDSLAIINNGKIITEDTTKNIMKLAEKGDYSKELTITFSKEIEIIPKNLESFSPEIIDKNRLKLFYSSKENPISDIINCFQKNNNIKDISTKEPDLEDIFRQLVKKH